MQDKGWCGCASRPWSCWRNAASPGRGHVGLYHVAKERWVCQSTYHTLPTSLPHRAQSWTMCGRVCSPALQQARHISANVVACLLWCLTGMATPVSSRYLSIVSHMVSTACSDDRVGEVRVRNKLLTANLPPKWGMTMIQYYPRFAPTRCNPQTVVTIYAWGIMAPSLERAKLVHVQNMPNMRPSSI